MVAQTENEASTSTKTRTEAESESRHTLVGFDDLPKWQQDNQYIISGYRRASYSYLTSLQSMLHWHNESINIWTHFLPGLLFVPLAIFLYDALKSRYEMASSADVYAMSCFLICVGSGMLMSGMYHTLSNHSPKVAKFWNHLDHAGIAFMIWGSFVPSVFYGFWCESALKQTYWTMITMFGIGCIGGTMLPAFQTPAWRPYRAAIFAAMGLSAVFPVFHGLRLYGLQQMQRQMGLFWLVLQGALYVTGAAIYACRFPESFNPGRYDKFGASHQIFHVFVVLAAASHLVGLLKAFDYRHGVSRGTCLSGI